MNNIYKYCRNGIIEKNIFWGLSIETCGLLKISLDKVGESAFFPIPDSCAYGYKYIYMTYINNKLYIAPYDGCNMYEFDMITEKFKSVEIPFSKRDVGVHGKFCACLSYDNTVLMIGKNINSIYIYDIQKEIFSAISYPDCKSNPVTIYQWPQIFNNQLLIPQFEDNSVLTLELTHMQWTKILFPFVEGKHCGISSMCVTQNDIYFTDYNDYLYCYSCDSKEHKKIRIECIDNEIKENNRYERLYVADDIIYLFPAHKRTVLTGNFNRGFDDVESELLTRQFKDQENVWELFYENSKVIHFQNALNTEVLELDIGSGKINETNIECQRDVLEEIQKYMLDNFPTNNENESFELKDFIKGIINEDNVE